VTTLNELPIRHDLRGKHPYGAPQKCVPIALNVNENTHPVPEKVTKDIIARIADALHNINRYPDREFVELREHLAAYLGHHLTAENMWAANGSNEVLQQILQAFGGPGRSVLAFTPTYSMYPILAAGTGTRWIAGSRDADYELSAQTVHEWVTQEKPDVTILCSPNNPTGTPVSLDAISAAYDASNGIVVVDEAYAEFMPHSSHSALTLLPGRERLIISRTMSKAFAFAGARVGYLAANPAITDALRLVRLPYHLSAITQAAAIGALEHASTMLAMVDNITAQRERLSSELKKLGYSPYRSWSNFLLIAGISNPQTTFSALVDRGILIRDVGIPGTLRLTVGTETENTTVLDTFADITESDQAYFSI
jgi:histidinol-phosphate aminotransferase